MAKVSKRTGNRRLLKLAAMLLADAKNKKGIKFDIGKVGAASDDKLASEAFADGVVPLDCGTTACAMGLAAISGKFKRQGLGYKIMPDSYSNAIQTVWKGRLRDYDTAAVKLFGITSVQAAYLFLPWTYPYDKREGAKGEREVIRRIKRVVEGLPIRDIHDNNYL